MADAYTVFWASHRCGGARASIEAGEPLTILFGGPHQSLPSFVKAKVSAGDLVYPIAVYDQQVFVLGRMRVREVRSFTVESTGRLFQEHVDGNPHWRFLADSCMTEAVIGYEGTVLRLDAAVPAEILRRLTYRSQRGSRTIRHLDEHGKLLRSQSLRGIYRLTEPCANDLDAVLSQPPSSATCCPRSARGEDATLAQKAADAEFWRSFSTQAPSTR